MQTLIQDLRYGARQLLKRPGFTLLAIISMALGIGANTAIFSLVDTVAFRPLPVRDPSLDELLDQCKPENRPEPIDFGPPVGREVI